MPDLNIMLIKPGEGTLRDTERAVTVGEDCMIKISTPTLAFRECNAC